MGNGVSLRSGGSSAGDFDAAIELESVTVDDFGGAQTPCRARATAVLPHPVGPVGCRAGVRLGKWGPSRVPGDCRDLLAVPAVYNRSWNKKGTAAGRPFLVPSIITGETHAAALSSSPGLLPGLVAADSVACSGFESSVVPGVLDPSLLAPLTIDFSAMELLIVKDRHRAPGFVDVGSFPRNRSLWTAGAGVGRDFHDHDMTGPLEQIFEVGFVRFGFIPGFRQTDGGWLVPE